MLEFAERKVDVAVMEAGLGGRWDASNAVDPAVALLTNVGTDHQRWLGESRIAIAAEKAAALRGRAAIVSAWDPEVEPTIRAAADPRTPLSLASEWDGGEQGSRGRPGRYRGCEGAQRQLAARGSQSGRPGGQAPRRSRLRVRISLQTWSWRWRGSPRSRGSTSPPRRPPTRYGAASRASRGRGACSGAPLGARRLLLDGAHNREAIAALAGALDEMGLSGKLHLLFSCLDDKPLDAMAALLRPRVVGVTVAPIRSPRARTLDDLAAAFPGCRRATSVAHALLDLQPGHPTLVTGSLRLVGEVLAGIGETDGRA